MEEDRDFPDIYDLFQVYNLDYFDGLLACVELKWSNRMTLCAGLCCYRDGLVSIKLSEPLLKYRTVNELKETLLHEMIHAYLMLTRQESGRDGHGGPFQAMMSLINFATGLNITIYHSFRDEVDYYRQHIWRCDGPCQDMHPYYGYVKRAMNRAPGPRDNWWVDHSNKCGGKFAKIAEPEAKKRKTKEKEPAKKRMKTLDQYFKS
jgi:predicted SprT family Zn-dependent metalloprotease